MGLARAEFFISRKGVTMAQVDREHLYRHLGRKIDGLQTRTPWNNAFYSLLASLYTPEEADLLVKMPNGLSTLGRVARITRYDRTELQVMLDRLSAKGRQEQTRVAEVIEILRVAALSTYENHPISTGVLLLGSDLDPVGEDRSAFNHVLHLSDIAGPGKRLQGRHRFRANVEQVLVEPVELGLTVPHDPDDVLAEGRLAAVLEELEQKVVVFTARS